MSVIINSTTVIFHNKTDYLIEIACEADQDETFHVPTVHKNIIAENVESSNTFFSTLVHMVYGSKIKKVFVNLPAKETMQVVLHSKTCLELSYSPKIQHSTNHITGLLPLSTEHQGVQLEVEFGVQRGIWHDEHGNVTIVGKTQAVSQDILIMLEIKAGDEKIFIDDYNPAICQLMADDYK